MKIFKRLLLGLGGLCLLLYVGYQAFLAFYSPVVTRRAEIQTVEDIITADAFAVRNEKLIRSDSKGILDYTVDDGSNVAKNGVVANIYQNSAEAENERKIRQLKNKIAQLQLSNVQGSTLSVGIDMLNEDIDNKFSQLSGQAASGNVEGIDSLETEFLNLLNEKQIATGTALNFNSRLASLKVELEQLQANQTGRVTGISAPVSGYFVSGSDGYENLFDSAGVLSITPGRVSALLAAKPVKKSGVVGRVFTSYLWYFVCNVSGSDADKLTAGNSVTVSMPLSAGGDFPAVVMAKNKGGGSETAVVLQCSYMSADAAAFRKGTVSIVANSYTGIKISDSAIHILHNQEGVYVLKGSTVQFEKLNVVYSGDGFVVSSVDSTNSGQLQLYDQVIVGGRNLYDGRIIK